MEALLVAAVIIGQFAVWAVGGVLLLVALRFAYRFITAPEKADRLEAKTPEPSPVERPTAVDPALAVPSTATPERANSPQSTQISSSKPSSLGARLAKFPDYARWGAGAAAASALLDVIQTSLSIASQANSDDILPALLAFSALFLVLIAPMLWLAWSYLHNPKGWKIRIILVLIVLGVIGDAMSIINDQNKLAMFDLFPSIFVLWYAIQSWRGCSAAKAIASGRPADPISNPAVAFSASTSRAVWGGVLVLGFIGFLLANRHQEPAVPVTSNPPSTEQSAPAPIPAAPAQTPITSAAANDQQDDADVIPTASGERPPGALITAWGENEENCRGALDADAPETKAACAIRDNAYDQLNKLGWCHGTKDDIDADRKWQRCAP